MYRFIDDEETEVHVGSQLSGLEHKENSIKPNDNVAKIDKIENENSNNQKSGKYHRYRKRKSLQEQLQNNRLYKYRERKKKLEKQNSSFKIRKDTGEFYGKLNEEKKAKKMLEKEIFDRELQNFRRQKIKLEKQKSKNQIDLNTQIIKIPETTEPNTVSSIENKEKTLKLVSYSDSDSE